MYIPRLRFACRLALVTNCHELPHSAVLARRAELHPKAHRGRGKGSWQIVCWLLTLPQKVTHVSGAPISWGQQVHESLYLQQGGRQHAVLMCPVSTILLTAMPV